MSHKTKECYNKVLSCLKLDRVRYTVTDFEKGLLSAIHETWPTAIRFGCLFHYVKCITKQMEKLRWDEIEHPDFQDAIQRFKYLGFSKIDDLQTAFENMLTAVENFDVASDDDIFKFEKYMLKNWIGTDDKDPVYHPAIWNFKNMTETLGIFYGLYFIKISFLGIRTNNEVETWHLKLREKMHTVGKPSWSRFFNCIGSEVNYINVKLARPQQLNLSQRDALLEELFSDYDVYNDNSLAYYDEIIEIFLNTAY